MLRMRLKQNSPFQHFSLSSACSAIMSGLSLSMSTKQASNSLPLAPLSLLGAPLPFHKSAPFSKACSSHLSTGVHIDKNKYSAVLSLSFYMCVCASSMRRETALSFVKVQWFYSQVICKWTQIMISYPGSRLASSAPLESAVRSLDKAGPCFQTYKTSCRKMNAQSKSLVVRRYEMKP